MGEVDVGSPIVEIERQDPHGDSQGKDVPVDQRQAATRFSAHKCAKSIMILLGVVV